MGIELRSLWIHTAMGSIPFSWSGKVLFCVCDSHCLRCQAAVLFHFFFLMCTEKKKHIHNRKQGKKLCLKDWMRVCMMCLCVFERMEACACCERKKRLFCDSAFSQLRDVIHRNLAYSYLAWRDMNLRSNTAGGTQRGWYRLELSGGNFSSTPPSGLPASKPILFNRCWISH